IRRPGLFLSSRVGQKTITRAGRSKPSSLPARRPALAGPRDLLADYLKHLGPRHDPHAQRLRFLELRARRLAREEEIRLLRHGPRHARAGRLEARRRLVARDA